MAGSVITYLGFDHGGRRLGVAVGQAVTGAARALTTLDCRNGRPDWDALMTLVREWQPGALVVGVPRHADGTASDSTQAAERFAQQLAGRTGLPVHTIDERLSSHEAAERLRDSGRDARSARAAGALDATAAAVILESWLLTQGTA